MKHRSIEDIFPTYYTAIPDMDDITRRCQAHWATAQCKEDITRWIENEPCPYMRETYAEGMFSLIQNAIDEQDSDYQMSPYIREEIEATLLHIIRYSRTDQLAEEMCQSELPLSEHTEHTPQEQHMTAMQKQLAFLTKEVQEIKKQIAQPAPSSNFLWPTYVKGIPDEDKRAFENEVNPKS